MMNYFFKIAMFFTSFIPLWVSVLFIDTLSIINNTSNLWSEIIGIVFIILGTTLSSVIICYSLKQIDNYDFRNYKILTATQEKGVTSEFLLSYILPLFAFDFTEWVGVTQFLIYFLVLSFLCVRNNNVYANLIFEIQRYKFYLCNIKWEVEEKALPQQVIVISRKNLCSNENNTVRLASLNKPFFISE